MNNISPVNFQGNYLPKTSLKKTIKSFYYSSKSPNYAPVGAKKLPLLTRVKKFFKSIIYANKI